MTDVEHGGICPRALSLEDSRRLWRSVLHGYTRRRHLPGGQRLSQRSLGLGTQAEGKRKCCQNKSATDWRELCHLGRTLLHYRLWFSSPEEERGPVELHNKWCSDWGHSGCTQWTGFHGGLCHDGGDSAGSDRGFRNPPHQIYGAAVSEPATLFRRARSFISRRWGSSAGGKGAVSVEEAGPESRCFYGDARRDGWF